MDQFLLDITPGPRPTLDNFVVGRNGELLAALRHALSGISVERCIYLWGDQGSGKSHLLSACANYGPDGIYAKSWVPEPGNIVAVDDVDSLDDAAQIALFNLYNLMREQGGMLIMSGAVSPLHLKLRDDLRTRLGWGLVYQVQTLSDEEKQEALARHALNKGFFLAPEISHYLLRHGRRDLQSLLSTLDALDEESRKLHRAPTIPLLKTILN